MCQSKSEPLNALTAVGCAIVESELQNTAAQAALYGLRDVLRNEPDMSRDEMVGMVDEILDTVRASWEASERAHNAYRTTWDVINPPFLTEAQEADLDRILANK